MLASTDWANWELTPVRQQSRGIPLQQRDERKVIFVSMDAGRDDAANNRQPIYLI